SNYVPLKNFEKDMIWKKASPRRPDAVLFTDLMNPYQSAACTSCKSIIPLSDFKNKKCSICGATLKVVDPNEIDRDKDSDSDGLSDVKEIELGMNPKDPQDVHYDMDNDGFSNIFEIQRGTKINDVKSHPPTAYRLYVGGIERKKLRLMLKKIIEKGDKKESWDINTYEYVPEKKKMDDKFRKLGDNITVDGLKYTIKDIISKKIEKLDTKANSKFYEDASEIIIQAGNESPIHVKLKSDVYENKETINVVDAFTNQKFTVLLNEKFAVTTPIADSVENYSVTKIINREGLLLEIVLSGTDQKFEIGPTPLESPKKAETTPNFLSSPNPEEIKF
nr:hypothetical protein [Victivallales bacterium]